MIDKLGHYSLTSPASIYDEEAMTALELAGRTAGKVNECVEVINQLDVTLDTRVEASVNRNIKDGVFDKQIDRHTQAITNEVNDLINDVSSLDKRVDNLVVNGAENSPEVVDIRVGADGKTYSTAGVAVRSQLRDKVSKVEYYDVQLEVGGLSITASGWDYSDTFCQNARVRVKSGHALKLQAGDTIGLTSYSDARFYLGFKVNGVYTYAGWRTSEYTVTTECECVILIAHASDNNPSKPEDVNVLGSLLYVKKLHGLANTVANTSNNLMNALDVDLHMIVGGMNNSEGVYGTRNRFVTADILKLSFDVVLKRSDKCRMAVHTYADTLGNSPSDKGWVTDKADYIIPAGTCFRVMVMAESYDVEASMDINPLYFYEDELYKAIRIEPLMGKGINLMQTARTLARLETFKALVRQKREAQPRKLRSVNHRGFNTVAPENTLKAFELSKANGFDYVECDVRFTSDGVAVLFHDDTVDRVTNGTGRVHTKTWSQLQALSFDYLGNSSEKIASFEDFVKACVQYSLHPYIEIEPNGDAYVSMAQIQTLVDTVKDCGMLSNVTWISFRVEDLRKVVSLDPFARVGLIVGVEDANLTKALQNLAGVQTGYNEAFFDVAYDNTHLNEICTKASEMAVPVEVWTVNDEETVRRSLNPYVSGVTSDSIHAENYRALMAGCSYFTVDGNSVPFRKGMTWADFMRSDYRKILEEKIGSVYYYKSDGTWVIYVDEWGTIINNDVEFVEPFDEIIPDHEYWVY